jgi:predicted enzyme related to lactoylglutathione lyase
MLRPDVISRSRAKGGAVDVNSSSRASRQFLTSAAGALPVKAELTMHPTILNITFDCADAGAQAAFWAAVTGWAAEQRDSTPGHVEYRVGPPDGSSPRLYFTTVPERKAAKNRVHLDLLPPDGEPRDELARLVSLGAVIAADQPAGASWIVLADPEGNEFCLEGAA